MYIPVLRLFGALAQKRYWENANLHGLIEDTVNELEVGFGKVGQPLRVALTGQSSGPANDEIMKVLGQEESINRSKNALVFLIKKLKKQGLI